MNLCFQILLQFEAQYSNTSIIWATNQIAKKYICILLKMMISLGASKEFKDYFSNILKKLLLRFELHTKMNLYN